MRKFGILAAAIVGVLAIPGSAAASHNGTCSHTALPVYAETTPNGSGSSGSADAAVGVCVDLGTGPFQGGTLEAGNGSSANGGGGGTYLIADGDDDNTGQAQGYQGLSSYETDGNPGAANCTGVGPDDPANTGTNSGGCFGPDGGPWLDLGVLSDAGVPTPICGNTSGNDWDSTNRDGCSIP